MSGTGGIFFPVGHLSHMGKFLVLILAVAFANPGRAQTAPAEDLVAYQPAVPFQAFLESDVRAVAPEAVIVRAGEHVKVGDRYLVRKDAARDRDELYLEILADWIEPVAAPQQSGEIRLALASGTVEAAPPATPTVFAPVAQGAVLAPGTTLRCGPASQAAVTLGARSAARFIAGTEGSVHLEGTAVEKVRIQLKSGAVFNRIRSMDKNVDYQVRTPQAVAAARGTDFVAVALPTVTDVWVAEGTVELMDLQGQSVGTVSAKEAGALKIIRFPQTPDPAQNAAANTTTMSVAMSLIPALNTTTAGLRGKTNLTPGEFQYTQDVQRVTYLVRVRKP